MHIQGDLGRVGAVGETLVTPLYAKARAREIAPEAGLYDPFAAELLARIAHDPARVLTDRSNAVGAIHRTLAIDSVTERFVRAHDGGLVLSLGIGLCTRRERLQDRVPPGVRWVGVDTDEVVAFRRRMLPEDGVELVPVSVAQPGWSGLLEPGSPTLVIAEGLLMYLAADGLWSVLTGARDRFGPGTELVADYFHPAIARSDRHPIVKATGARFLSGARNGAALAAVVPGYELVGELPVMERIGRRHQLAARAFQTITRGGRPYGLAHLRVVARG